METLESISKLLANNLFSVVAYLLLFRFCLTKLEELQSEIAKSTQVLERILEHLNIAEKEEV